MARVWVAALAALMIIGSAAAAVAGDAEDCSNYKALLKTDPARTGQRRGKTGKLQPTMPHPRLQAYMATARLPPRFRHTSSWLLSRS